MAKRLMTVLAVAVMCDGKGYEEGTPIDQIPAANRESVRLRYCHDVMVDDEDESPRPPRQTKTAKPTAALSAKVDPPSEPPAPTVESATSDSGPAAASDVSAPADEAPQTVTPLPTMAEELVALLKAGGIETIEAAKDYFSKNKSFRPLKGIGEAKDLEIRAALGL